MVLVCVGVLVGCSGGGTPLYPASPTATTISRPSDLAGYEEAPIPAPGVPLSPDPTLGPPPLTVSIVGSFGPGAFIPNPLPALIGNVVVWTNTDLVQHVIALDDGTIVGDLAPGQSTAPIAISAPSVGYHCVLHPSMTGTISDPALIPPAMPDPPYTPPPDYYDY